jgi:opacity protein-like surface antigen
MRNHFLLFCSLFMGCMLSAHAQKLQLSVEGGAQQSFIPNRTEAGLRLDCPSTSGYCSGTKNYDIDYSYQERPAGYVNARLSYNQSERLQYYHTLGLSLLRFQAKVLVRTTGENGSGNCFALDENGNPMVVACENSTPDYYNDDHMGKTSLLYLSQELGARYKVASRLWVQAGVDLSYRLHSQFYVPVLQYSQGDGYTVSIQNDRSGTGFGGVLVGVHTALAYDLTDQLSLTMGLQHSLTPLYTEEIISSKGYEKSRASQLRLGLAYRIKSW